MQGRGHELPAILLLTITEGRAATLARGLFTGCSRNGSDCVLISLMRTRIKICGLTREQDIAAAVEAGADALGFVFYPKSKRFLTVERAAQLRKEIPAFVSLVALFVNASADEIRAVQEGVQPDLLQFHGDETVEECRAHGQRYLKAFRVGAPGLDTPEGVLQACLPYDDAAGWLFDSYTPQYGGSGASFDLGLLRDVRGFAQARPVLLSGGMKAESVGEAVRVVQPWGVDVSSGVEVEAGVKSAEKIEAFFRTVATTVS